MLGTNVKFKTDNCHFCKNVWNLRNALVKSDNFLKRKKCVDTGKNMDP